jgi:hypothetical protein
MTESENLPENRASRLARDNRGRWKKGQSGNAGGRGSRESDLRNALNRGADDAIKTVLEAARDGDLLACKLILERCVPVRKAQIEPVEFMCDTTDFSQAAMSVIAAISRGQVSPDVGGVILAGIGNALKIKEVDELERRIAQLEQLTKGDD